MQRRHYPLKTTEEDSPPQWLQEVLKRGFVPPRTYNLLNVDDMFAYIPALDKRLCNIPNKRVYVLEGLPGSGKTSIANRLTARKNLLVLPQILPKEPKFDQTMPINFYLKSEELKTQKIEAAYKQNYILDRYYVSTMAFYWARDELKGTKEYLKVFNWYKKSMENGKIVKPFVTFLIKTPIGESLKRKNRRPSNDLKNLWLNKKFLALVNDYYDYFYQAIEPRSTLVILDGLLPLERSFLYVQRTLISKI